jgi:hypothetical protein
MLGIFGFIEHGFIEHSFGVIDYRYSALALCISKKFIAA